MESCLRSCCYQEVWIHVTNQSPFQIQKRRMSGLVMDQAHMWVENLDRYGAWKLIGPHVAATKWCTHIYFLKTTPEGERCTHISSSAVGKKNHIPGFNKNSLTSALYLSDYSTQRFVPSNMGSPSVSLLSARSSQYSFDRLPRDGGGGTAEVVGVQGSAGRVQWNFLLSHCGCEQGLIADIASSDD